MPNLKPPITTTVAAIAYRESILKVLPSNCDFTPLMTLYLTDATKPEEIRLASKSGLIFSKVKMCSIVFTSLFYNKLEEHVFSLFDLVDMLAFVSRTAFICYVPAYYIEVTTNNSLLVIQLLFPLSLMIIKVFLQGRVGLYML